VRVIAGWAKGKVLKSVPGKNTRPTTDKVKESLFNILTPYLPKDGVVLDLYAGTGGLGIEALSRGMGHAIFIDYDRNSIDTIKQNLDIVGFLEKAEVYRNDATRALKALIKREMRFDLILLDPPYKMNELAPLIELIHINNLIYDNGVIVIEHDAKTLIPEFIPVFNTVKSVIYGNTGITILQYRIGVKEE